MTPEMESNSLSRALDKEKKLLTYTLGGKLIYFVTQEVRQVENTNCSLKGLEKPVGYRFTMASWVDCDLRRRSLSPDGREEHSESLGAVARGSMHSWTEYGSFQPRVPILMFFLG